jgi:hypothetical protein
MPHPAALPIDKLLADCRFATTRRSGPGGQHRNKVETAVIVTHLPTGVRAEANEQRSQAANRATAVRRLRVKLALAVRGGAAARSSELWLGRAAGGRIAVNPEHDDFPALVAEALDAIAHRDWDSAAAAEFLSVSLSQLVKLLKLEPQALSVLNAQRTARGHAPLR